VRDDRSDHVTSLKLKIEFSCFRVENVSIIKCKTFRSEYLWEINVKVPCHMTRHQVCCSRNQNIFSP
jgi:hypothetical protein